VDEVDDGRFTAHSMIRMHAVHVAERSSSESERASRLRRVVDWYLASGQAADRRVTPQRLRLPGAAVSAPAGSAVPELADDREALDWLEREHGALLGCVRIAAEHQWDEMVWLLCDPLWALYQSHKHYAAWVEAFTRAIEAAERAGRGWVCARLRCLLSRAYTELGQFEQAADCLGPALDLARLERDRQLEASVVEFTGIVALRAGRNAEALEQFGTARAVLADGEQTPDARRADLILRYQSARAHTAEGRAATAISMLEAAYPEASASDARLAGQVRFALVEALLQAGDAQRARDLAAEAVAEAGRRAVPVEQVRALRLLGRAFADLGDAAMAEQYTAHADALQQGLEGSSPVSS
jgi:tetratricopeptide (TPR) repeat protein